MAKKKGDVIEWLRSRTHLSVSALERTADIPAGLVTKALNGRQALADKHKASLEKVLAAYGFK